MAFINPLPYRPTHARPFPWHQITKYHKDTQVAYRPFLSLLGTGIVTSDGQKWRKQRNKVGIALKESFGIWSWRCLHACGGHSALFLPFHRP